MVWFPSGEAGGLSGEQEEGEGLPGGGRVKLDQLRIQKPTFGVQGLCEPKPQLQAPGGDQECRRLQCREKAPMGAPRAATEFAVPPIQPLLTLEKDVKDLRLQVRHQCQH